jgi:hypothetical protein
MRDMHDVAPKLDTENGRDRLSGGNALLSQ